MENNRKLLVMLFLLVGSGRVYAQGTPVAASPPVQRAAQPMSTYATALSRARAGCPIGMYVGCGKVRNGLGPGLAIVEIRVNDGPPVVMNPNAGTLPLPRLLDGQSTDFPWPPCTRRNQFGSCMYKYVGFAVPIIDMTGLFPDLDPRSEEYQLLIQADLKNGERFCFEVEIAVSLGMRQSGLFVSSIEPGSILNQCPFGMVPKSATIASGK